MKNIIWIAIAVCSSMLYSCGGGSANTAGDEHAHENVVLQITEYSNDFELYAEAKPFVVGQAGDLLAHFTFLSNFKPLENGSITASLIVGKSGIRQTLEKPIQKGIFLFTFTPNTEGVGKLVFDIKDGSGISYQLVVPNIVVYADKHTAEHEAEASAAQSGSAIAFLKEQSWKVDFATELPKMEPFGQIIKAMAQIMPTQGDERMITAKSNGVITFSGDNLTLGETVNAGAPLMTILAGGMADNNIGVRYAEAKSNYGQARANYERNLELIKDKIVSEQQFLESKTAYQNAKTIFENLDKNFSSGKEAVTSPMMGYIGQIFVKAGEYVEAGSPLAIVTQNRNLLVKAEVQPKYYSLLGNITSANFRTVRNGKTYSLEELSGKVLSYSKSADAGNYLIPVIFQILNGGNFVSGGFVEVFIKTESSKEALTIPREAIMEEMGNYFVFVQLTPELFEKRLIKRGATDGKRTEVTEGLTALDRIVTKGAILVRLAQASGTLDAHSGHVH